MKQSDLSNLPTLSQSNYENIFNIYQDKDSRYYYNLLQTISIPSNIPDSYFDRYQVVAEDTFPFISWKVYGITELWWIIAEVNNIIDPTQQLEPGTTLKTLKTDIVSLILSQI
jgi:hypothetical protein